MELIIQLNLFYKLIFALGFTFFLNMKVRIDNLEKEIMKRREK